MIKTTISEIKKSLTQKSTYAYFAGIIGLVLLANIAVVCFRIIYGANEGTYAYNLLEYATWCFIIPYYSCIFIADIGKGKDYPNPLIKDGSNIGFSRTMIYISKLLISFVLGVIFMLVAVLALMGITSLFQIRDGGLTAYAVTDFLEKMVIAIPIWYAGISFGMMFLMLFEKKKMAIIYYFILTLIIPRIIMIFAAEPFKIAAFRLIRKYTLTQNLSLVPYLADPARNVQLTIALGLIYGTIATIIGLVGYNKKKFK